MTALLRNNIKLPLSLSLSGSRDVLVCESMLRFLPGRRFVTKGVWQGREVVAKVFVRCKLRCPFHSPVQRESKGHAVLKKCGLLTPEILYVGSDQEKTVDIVIFVFHAPSEDSRAAWNSTDKQVRDGFIKKILSNLAVLHENGVLQKDLHPSNFILSGDSCSPVIKAGSRVGARDNGRRVVTSGGHMFTIDVANIRDHHYGRPLPLSLSLKNIGELFGQLAVYYDESVTDYIKFYAQKRSFRLKPCDYAFVKKCQARTRKRREKKYLKKIFKNCTRFICQRSWKRVVACARPDHTQEMRKVLDNLDKACEQGELIKAGNTNTLLKIKVNNKYYVIKRYNIKNNVKRMKRWFMQSRAARSWKNAGRLYFHHVNTPRPVALVENKWGPFRGRVYFISEWVQGLSLLDFLVQDALPEASLNHMVEQIKQLFNAMASLRLSHGDLKATNFIVRDEIVYITDLDVMKKHVCSHKLRSALMRDKRRFLRNWDYDPDLKAAFLAAIGKSVE